MKKSAKLITLALALALLFSLAACGTEKTDSQPSDLPAQTTPSATPEATLEATPEANPEPVTYNLGLIKGPTGMGGVFIMEGAANDLYIESDNIDYEITLAAAPTDLTALLINGELDIAALPTNVAASLYNKTEGGIQLLALNTMGVLYILENGDSVQSVSDLAGKTIYATGQGANPEFVLNHILTSNDLTPGTDVTIEWRDSDELTTLMATGEIEICMLPVPAATAVQMKNDKVRSALDITAEWRNSGENSELIMGCIVARTEFIKENPEAVSTFMKHYEESVKKAQSDEAAAALMAEYEIVANEAIAKAAIPSANLCYIIGSDIHPTISGYYEVLFAADPTSIGGAIPGEEFYYREH